MCADRGSVVGRRVEAVRPVLAPVGARRGIGRGHRAPASVTARSRPASFRWLLIVTTLAVGYRSQSRPYCCNHATVTMVSPPVAVWWWIMVVGLGSPSQGWDQGLVPVLIAG